MAIKYATTREFASMICTLCLQSGATRREKGELVPDIAKSVLTAYWEALKDIPVDVLEAGFQMVANESRWRGLPPVGAIRSACVTVACGVSVTPGEAWAMVRSLLQRASIYDTLEVRREQMRALTPDVAEVVRRVGLRNLQDLPVDKAMGLFISEYRSLEYKRRAALSLPGGWPEQLSLPVSRMKGLVHGGGIGNG